MNKRIFSCDFETVVYPGQESTEVWLSGAIELYSDNPVVFTSIDDLFNYFNGLECDCVAYYHNLKFDGEFYLSYFLRILSKKGWRQAYDYEKKSFYDTKYMRNKTFKYSISARGQFYTLTWKYGGHIIQLRDSLKLLPFPLKQIGKDFHTAHQKTEMEYVGKRHAGGAVTEDELEYFKNDLYVLKEALEICYDKGLKRLTIGSNCLTQFKKQFMNAYDFSELFPTLHTIPLKKEMFGSDNVYQYLLKAYRGGWCYLVPGKSERVLKNGVTADINSHYPSQMHSLSGNRYAVGDAHMWSGDFIPKEALRSDCVYYVRFKCQFDLKGGKLPFVQIKNSYLYSPTEHLTTSKFYDSELGEYCDSCILPDGSKLDSTVTLTMYYTELELFKEHYDVQNFEILDGVWFYALSGIFDDYIDYYMEIKMVSKGAERALAKLFLNNLYGKFATTDDSSFKVAYLEDDIVKYETVVEHEKEPVYIAVGAAITANTRIYTVRHAQENYHGDDLPGFVYADTDSIHCDMPADKLVNIDVHPTNLLHWKVESTWDEGIFARQKTYIEHITENDLKPVDPYYNVTCAGMSKFCQQLVKDRLEGVDSGQKLTGDVLNFMKDDKGNIKGLRLDEFKVGFEVPGKLRPRRLPGGIVLEETTFKVRKKPR